MDGQLLGFEEVQKLALTDELDTSYIHKIDTLAQHIELTELVDLWGKSATFRILTK